MSRNITVFDLMSNLCVVYDLLPCSTLTNFLGFSILPQRSFSVEFFLSLISDDSRLHNLIILSSDFPSIKMKA